MAEEVLQRVYLKMLEGKARFEGRSTFKTWLFSVIRNTTAEERRRRLFRKLRFFELEPTDDERSDEDGPDDTIQRADIRSILERALAALPKRQQQVLHLVFYQGLTLEETAPVLGISVGSVRTHYERGKVRLRRQLEELEDFEDVRRARKHHTRVLQATEAKG